MHTVSFPRSLTTLGSPSNLLYLRRDLHLDGLHRARQLKVVPNGSHAHCAADRLHNPRWGFLTSLDGQSVVGNKDCTNNLTQGRHFLPDINVRVSMPKKQ